MSDRRSSRSVFRPIRDRFVNAWHHHVSKKYPQEASIRNPYSRTHADVSVIPPAVESELRHMFPLTTDNSWEPPVFNESFHRSATYDASSAMICPFPYPYTGPYPCHNPSPDFRFTTSDTVFDSAYFLSNDIETIATILEQVYANNLKFLVDNPYWNYGICPPLMENLGIASKYIVSQLKGEPLVTLDLHFPEFTNLLASLQYDNKIQRVLYEQKKKGENMRFLQAYKFDDKKTFIKNGLVPVVIVGIFCAEIPVSASYEYVPVDANAKRTIKFVDRNHIFHEFNTNITRLEQQISFSMKQYPIFNELTPYKGPRFSMRPIIFTNLSEYGWQLVQLTHIFQFQDPILKALPNLLKQMYNYLSNPVKQNGSPPHSPAPKIFESPDLTLLMSELTDHYTVPNMDLYLKQKPWGRPSLVSFNINSDKHIDAQYLTQLNQGDECAICLLEYKECEICLHLNCEHVFHKSCIEQWINSSNDSRCPLCRRINKKVGLY